VILLCSKCEQAGKKLELLCEHNVCLVEPEIISRVNTGGYRFSWRASNYSMFWGRRLDEGISLRLGTLQPQKAVFFPWNIYVVSSCYNIETTTVTGLRDPMTLIYSD